MGKSLEYALKIMSTKETRRRNIIVLGPGRDCTEPMDGGVGCWSPRSSDYCVLHVRWFNSEHMTLVIVLNS